MEYLRSSYTPMTISLILLLITTGVILYLTYYHKESLRVNTDFFGSHELVSVKNLSTNQFVNLKDGNIGLGPDEHAWQVDLEDGTFTVHSAGTIIAKQVNFTSTDSVGVALILRRDGNVLAARDGKIAFIPEEQIVNGEQYFVLTRIRKD